ncbi:lysozyme inhibitor LprI family protein [Gluconobacter japonicus]|nr:lysozyme inhibitor LprI family protein [Gluconobacter japonicus]KXV27545.1 hypothetical protein AD938_06920 [Gluconobacter japonicus]
MAGWKMCLLIAAFSLASPVLAQHYNAANAPCKQAGSGVDQTNCLTVAAQRADKELDVVYDQILTVLKSSRKTQLQKAQQAWFYYRDETCEAEHDLFEGGTAGLAALPACREALTRHRISDLRDGYWWLVEKFGARQDAAPLHPHGEASP